MIFIQFSHTSRKENVGYGLLMIGQRKNEAAIAPRF